MEDDALDFCAATNRLHPAPPPVASPLIHPAPPPVAVTPSRTTARCITAAGRTSSRRTQSRTTHPTPQQRQRQGKSSTLSPYHKDEQEYFPIAFLLAVTSANTNLASIEDLKLARELDPRGERTIGVLTKLDLMDPGTDASKILHNRIVPLRRVNRGQRNIDAGLSIRVGLRNEKRFFRTYPAYSRRTRRHQNNPRR